MKNARDIGILGLLGILGFLWSCGNFPYRPGYDRVIGRTTNKGLPTEIGWTQTGMASYYGLELKGRRTASGEVFDPFGLTAAHKTLPFNTIVEVTDLETFNTVDVRINDRGPFHGSRIIDISLGAAKKLGSHIKGHMKVKIEVVELPTQ